MANTTAQPTDVRMHETSLSWPVRRRKALFSQCVFRRMLPFIVLAMASSVSAQPTASDVVRTAQERQAARIASIDDVTIIQTVDGREQLVYLERRDSDEGPQLVPVGPFRMLLVSGALDETPLGELTAGGSVLGGVRDAMVGAAAAAGLESLRDSLLQAADGPLADFIGPLLTPTGSTPAPGATLVSLTDTEHLRSALLEGARRAAVRELRTAVLNAAVPELGSLLEALRGRTSPGELLGELSGMLGKVQLPGLGTSVPGLGDGSATPGTRQRAGDAARAAGLEALTRGMLLAAAQRTGDMIDRGATASILEIDAWEILAQVDGRVSVAGIESIDGAKSWVLNVENLAGVAGLNTREFRRGALRIWIDKEAFVPRRVSLTGEARVDRKWTPIDWETRHRDYRKVDGLLLPFHTTTRLAGLSDNISPRERRRMQQDLEEMRARIEAVPEAQREMVERMMQGLMPQIEAMLSAGGPSLETRITEVRVDAGIPEVLLREARQMTEAMSRS